MVAPLLTEMLVKSAFVEAGNLVITAEYPLRVIKSSAVATTLMVFAPTFKRISELGVAFATSFPFTKTDPFASDNIGVAFIADTAYKTVLV